MERVLDRALRTAQGNQHAGVVEYLSKVQRRLSQSPNEEL